MNKCDKCGITLEPNTLKCKCGAIMEAKTIPSKKILIKSVSEIILYAVTITLLFNCILVAIYPFIFSIELVHQPFHILFIFMLDFFFGSLIYDKLKKIYEINDNFEVLKSKQDVDVFLAELKHKDLSHLGIDEVRKIKEIIESKSQQNIQ